MNNFGNDKEVLKFVSKAKKNIRDVNTNDVNTNNDKIYTKPTLADILKQLDLNDYSKVPYVHICIDLIARLVATMQIDMLEKKDNGTVVVENALSYKVNINPYSVITKTDFYYCVVRDLLLYGNSVCMIEYTDDFTNNGTNLIKDLIPLGHDEYSIVHETYLGFYNEYRKDYYVTINGIDGNIDRRKVLHFKKNNYDPKRPWLGHGIANELKEVLDNLLSSQQLKSRYYKNPKPNTVISVTGQTSSMDTEDDREKFYNLFLRNEFHPDYLIVSGESIGVSQLNPHTLKDMGLTENNVQDIAVVAKLFGVPKFALGIGDFDETEFNNFVTTTIMPICNMITDEMTKKLLYSRRYYFKFTKVDLLSVNIKDMTAFLGMTLDSGTMTPNEARNILGLTPIDGGDERVILNNYIAEIANGKSKKTNDNDEKNKKEDGLKGGEK